METINTSVSFTLLGLCCEEGKHTNATHKYNLQPTRGREEDGEVRGGQRRYPKEHLVVVVVVGHCGG